MQNIDATIKLTHYLQIDINNHGYDDTENMAVEVDVTYTVAVLNNGINVDVPTVKAVRWSYTGIKFGDDDNGEHPVTGSSDETWNIKIDKSKADKIDIGLFLEDVSINLETKEIEVNFEF